MSNRVLDLTVMRMKYDCRYSNSRGGATNL